MKVILFSLFLIQIAFAVEITNKAGKTFQADILGVTHKDNGVGVVKVRRAFDNTEFEIPLSTLHEKTLIDIINHLAKGKKAEAPPARPKVVQNALPNKQNSDWKSFDGKLISDFRSDPKRWNRKNVIIYANFEYKSSYNEQISVEQGDNSIWVNYAKLSRREKSVILEEKNFSERIVKVDGSIVLEEFSENGVLLIADKIEFVK